MGGRGNIPSVRRAILTAGLFLAASSPAAAERLPLKSYTTADGLAHNNVQRIVRDSRGFLWFCTFGGLSRFDGYGFISFGVDQGLPNPVVNDLLETREGVYWVATDGGLCLLDPRGNPNRSAATGPGEPAAARPLFTTYFPGEDPKSKEVTALFEDASGAVWCGTGRGLYRLQRAGQRVEFQQVDLGMPMSREVENRISSIIADRRGALWIGSASGIYRLLPDSRAERYSDAQGVPPSGANYLLEDREGRLWVGGRFKAGLYRLVSNPDPSRHVVERAYTEKDGLPTRWIYQIYQASDGSLWAGSNNGLIQFIPTLGDFRFRYYSEAIGLVYPEVRAVAEDRNGNLWIGMPNGGAAKLARSGISSFGKEDGFQFSSAIFQDSGGDLLVIGGLPHRRTVHKFDGVRFHPVEIDAFKQDSNWGWNQLMLQDHIGEWWLGTTNGLLRFPRTGSVEHLARTRPIAVYGKSQGLADNGILRLFEDSRGDIWISTVERVGLSRWERVTNTFRHYDERDGLPTAAEGYPISFCEDRAGDIWIGFSVGGGLVRYTHGSFVRFTRADGLPEGGIFNLFIDSAGSLWVPTTRGGVCRIDHPEAERPILRTYTTTDGISSNDVKCVTQDTWGRIYLGTARGIDRLDAATGRVKHYTAADGALLGDILAAQRDRQGALWFSVPTGLMRLVPETDSTPVPPPILITGLRIAGKQYPISVLGEAEPTPVELGADQAQLRIDFTALGFSTAEALRYQYKLEGAGGDWSPLAEQRTVDFANLAPGRYRFLVRAVNADAVASDVPASFSFTILPPVWRRWWFQAAAAAGLCLFAYALYRYRVAQLLKIERVRTSIAADLHDDIGANLSKIAVLSEVAHHQLGGESRIADSTLSSIANISRESVSSMRDIVWAVNPRRDRLSDLTRRMRSFASDIFTSRGIEFKFQAPDRDRELKLAADVRRDVFLIFKEAVNNAVRHSDCAKATISLRIDAGTLALEISDDGKGICSGDDREGHGISGMQRRAQNFGGKLDIISQQGKGTTVRLLVPIGSRCWSRRKVDGSVSESEPPWANS